MEIQATGGNVRLDFSQAVITGPVLQIEAEVKGGNFVIVTRPGIVIDTSGVEMVGGSMHLQPPRYRPPPTVLRIQISGRVAGGNLRTRGPRRTFWQWLLRRPLRRHSAGDQLLTWPDPVAEPIFSFGRTPAAGKIASITPGSRSDVWPCLRAR